VWSADTKEIEHCRLGFENCAAADGADFDAGHADGDLEVAVETGKSLVRGNFRVEGEGLDILLHHGDAVTALNILCWILTRSEEDSRHHVRGMGIETSNTASHSRTNEVLADVQLH
jgi:hypothetical protein